MAERLISLPSSSHAPTTLPIAKRHGKVPVPLTTPRQEAPSLPRIAVVGIGGAGNNALTRIGPIDAHVVRRFALNTDAQALTGTEADERLCLGESLTHGHGAGGVAAVGERAAEASRHHIAAQLRRFDLIFVLAGLGGGTGTGAAPVVARIGRELGALVVGMVALPFTFEGAQRRQIAHAGLALLAPAVDALITIPNDRLLGLGGQHQGLNEAFIAADSAFRRAIAGVVAIITTPGLINVDFADVRAVLRQAGPSLMGQGEASGAERASRAVEDALHGGGLGASLRGARRVLLNLTASPDVSLREVMEITTRVTGEIDPQADCAFGAVIDPRLSDTVRVTLIAGGLPLSLSA